ncbi:uncharacterized protein LOC121506406 isoform X1 [Cheilinus undulatus]|uniref:uncharacterized protein LOC121506406 isoform X1 n=1 Tax=Cheilinus undulatus TaxID=241271 RepID=UPI001BD4D9C2|nr:uncharacterized protein LOC121506406 isoform X1 [Cheilinus undulatus]
MDLIWVLLLLFLLCGEAKNVTKVKASLGQNATLLCSFIDGDIYWFMEVHSGFRSCIIRTFGKRSFDSYIFTSSEDKFNITQGNRLLISNITAEDYRLYFCARKQSGELQFETTFSLGPDSGDLSPPSQDDSQSELILGRLSRTELIMYASLVLNTLLLMVLAFLSASLCLKKRTCERTDGDPSATRPGHLEGVESPQYEEIQLSDRAPPPVLSRDDIYSKAGFPQSMPPPQTLLDRY